MTGLDLVLRPQNAVAKATVEKRQKAREKSHSDSESISDSSELIPSSPASSVSSWDSIPPILAEDENTHMTSFFFTSYVLYPHDQNTDRGFMEHLPMAYSGDNPSSPLSTAVNACCHAVYGVWAYRMRDFERLFSSPAYTEGLKALSRAIMDPAQAEKDETIMAACLLGFFEGIIDAYKAKISSPRHFNGAAALVAQRNGKPKSPLFRRLIMGIRSNLVERAIDQGFAIDTSTALWQDDGDMDPTPAMKFDMLCVEAANILAAIKVIRETGNAGYDQEKSSELKELVLRAIACDSNFASWPDNLPEYLFPMALSADEVPPTVKAAGLYRDICDIYFDVNTCVLWNDWRAIRIKILKVVIGYGTLSQREIAMKSLQALADEICASIPFILGDRMVFTPLYTANNVYPGGDFLPKSHQLIAAAHGGWFTLSPMRDVWTSARQGLLREGQSTWISVQLTRLGTIYDAQPEHKMLKQALSPSL